MVPSPIQQKLRLPPNVQLRRRRNAYVIFYGDDEVGGVVVAETLSDDTQLRPYVKAPVELNRDIVALVAQQMADALIEHVARQPDGARHPLSSPAPFPARRSSKTPCSPVPAAGE